MKVEKDGYTIVFDPYTDGSVPGYSSLQVEANQTICSHEHADHFGKENVKIRKSMNCPWQITRIRSYHDHEKGTKRGVNQIHILTDDTFRLAHMGDIGCMPAEEQMKQLRHLDVMMVPVGGYYTMEVNQIKSLIHQLQPRVVIPMHYRFEQYGYPEIGTLDPFIEGESAVIHCDQFKVSLDKRPQIAILKNYNTL